MKRTVVVVAVMIPQGSPHTIGVALIALALLAASGFLPRELTGIVVGVAVFLLILWLDLRLK